MNEQVGPLGIKPVNEERFFTAEGAVGAAERANKATGRKHGAVKMPNGWAVYACEGEA